MSLATQQLSSLVTPPPQGDSDTSVMKIEIGPSHPAMHGIVRFTTYLDGELIVGMEPEIGYLHRGFEKESENSKRNLRRTIIRFLKIETYYSRNGKHEN